MTWDRALVALVLIRVGQELGTDSPLAKAVSGVIDAVFRLAQ